MTADARAAVIDGDHDPDTFLPTLGTAYAEDLRGIVDRGFTFGKRYGDQQGRADRRGADPRILEFERKMVRVTFKLGIPIFAHCVVRGQDEQNRLFVKGFSKARWPDSAHNRGAAVDLVHGTLAWDLTLKQWDILGHLGKEAAASLSLDVTWGGDWKFYDPAHWELKGWSSLPPLQGEE